MAERDGLIAGADGIWRCWWCGDDGLYRDYHDREWGRPVAGDIRLFEKVCLEGFQSGLSWLTILRKRENFRAAFDGFDFRKVAAYDARRCRAAAGQRRHNPSPGQDRGDDRQRDPRGRTGRRSRLARGILLALRDTGGRQARPAGQGGARNPRPDRTVEGAQQGSEKTRLEIRRADHLLRLHAGDGAGQ